MRRLPLLLTAGLFLAGCGGGGGRIPVATTTDVLAMGDQVDASSRTLARLAEEFYGRIANRRLNSIATYQDPALREFFHSEESWSDYYADLVQVLDASHFASVRPTRIGLLDVALESPGHGLVRVRFTGKNALPLRWWETHVVREDRWEWDRGRWWIVPGKL